MSSPHTIETSSSHTSNSTINLPLEPIPKLSVASKVEQMFQEDTIFKDILEIKFNSQNNTLKRNITFKRENLEDREILEKLLLERKFQREYNKRLDKYKSDRKHKIQKKRLDNFNKQKKLEKEAKELDSEMADFSE